MLTIAPTFLSPSQAKVIRASRAIRAIRVTINDKDKHIHTCIYIYWSNNPDNRYNHDNLTHVIFIHSYDNRDNPECVASLMNIYIHSYDNPR